MLPYQELNDVRQSIESNMILLILHLLVSLKDEASLIAVAGERRLLMIGLLTVTRLASVEYSVILTYVGADPTLVSSFLVCPSSEPRTLPTPGQITLTQSIASHGDCY